MGRLRVTDMEARDLVAALLLTQNRVNWQGYERQVVALRAYQWADVLLEARTSKRTFADESREAEVHAREERERGLREHEEATRRLEKQQREGALQSRWSNRSTVVA